MLSRSLSVRILSLVLAASLLELAASPRAQAANEEEARVYLDKATAAYALNKYAIAAENFEKAFELKPDPALLYNAAQAYRLGGNKERALALYESYLRVYGKKGATGREQIETRIRELKQAIQHDRSVATSPPVTTLPVGKATEPPAAAAPAAVAPPPAAAPPAPVAVAPVTPVPPVAPVPAPAPAATLPPAPPPADKTSNDPTMLTRSASQPDDESITKKPLFWVGVGGGVVAVGLVVLLLVSGGEKAASPSLGQVEGN